MGEQGRKVEAVEEEKRERKGVKTVAQREAKSGRVEGTKSAGSEIEIDTEGERQSERGC